ncbi:cysteine desulfurase CsdA [Saccharobesus litoralis]|uniref:Cysteine desulfurase n=1 Tax=Saccharobesus litoralis TaxID=2172099 RepID=A0A2S0VLY6_9ALTE|nr:SufS family cysteine desulfurase [Saccharobesus litoralis]AWB65226.1 cysteine desulfurase CsdA [Saccharobesus litoralis]
MKTPDYILAFRQQFPLLVNNPELIYLDNAATTQKPQCLLDSISHFYSYLNANTHRANHQLASSATQQFELAREQVQHFINAKHSKEIIWTKGTTESINLLAQVLSQCDLLKTKGKEILVSQFEHHANLIPWQQVCQSLGLTLTVVEVENMDANSIIKRFAQHITEDTALVACTHVSNALGVRLPVEQIVELAKSHNAFSLIDGAQAINHHPIDVQVLDCDFYVFSAHKMYGATGLGVLYGKQAILEQLPPYQFGGEMVSQAQFHTATFNQLPHKFEAGTSNTEAVVAFGALLDWLTEQNRDKLHHYEQQLSQYLYKQLQQLDFVQIISPKTATGSIAFNLIDWHPADVGELLSQMNIAVRVGHHCAQPLMTKLGLSNGCIRASIAAYNTVEEINKLITGLQQIKEFE